MSGWFLTPFKIISKFEKDVRSRRFINLDEIQPGFGRTENCFFRTYGWFQIFCDGKGMGGGVPVGAFMSSPEIMKSLQHSPKLGHITTFE